MVYKGSQAVMLELPSAPIATPRPAASLRRLRVGFLAAGAAAAAILLVAGSAESSNSRDRGSAAVSGEDAGALYRNDPVTPLAEPLPADESIVVEADPLRDVYWRAAREMSLGELAKQWSIRPGRIADLNPDLVGKSVTAGTPVLVHQFSDESPPRSLGRPGEGGLRNGIPMPEGNAWRLRKGRRNYYGTWFTISNLVHALEAYDRTFPDAPPVRIGDISARSGGTLRHHKSHQSGRDVDLLFVLHPPKDGAEDEDAHRRVGKGNIDAEKNWFLIRALVDAGSVDSIFMSARVQNWIREAALRDVSPDAVEEYFSYISYEPGHTEHMHVRFSHPRRG